MLELEGPGARTAALVNSRKQQRRPATVPSSALWATIARGHLELHNHAQLAPHLQWWVSN